MDLEKIVIPEAAFNPALGLLAQLLGLRKVEIQTALDSKHNPGYQTAFVPKGKSRRGKRRLDIPPEPLKIVQKVLLERCLYHIVPVVPGWAAMTGFFKGASIRRNVESHLRGNAFFQFDLKDAFPTVTSEMVRKTLEFLFSEKNVRRMFRFKDVRWFYFRYIRQQRRKKGGSQQLLPFLIIDPLTILWAFREIIIWLTIHEDRLPQGAPTSPFLLNLVLTAFEVPAKIKAFLENYGRYRVTIYADDITISTLETYIPEEVREGVIQVVETETPFTVNPKKTRYTERRQRSPHITGLALADGRHGLDNITVPKEFQRRARNLIHRAIFEPSLRAEALGIVAFLLDVYCFPDFLPNQIKRPYEKLLAVIKEE